MMRPDWNEWIAIGTIAMLVVSICGAFVAWAANLRKEIGLGREENAETRKQISVLETELKSLVQQIQVSQTHETRLTRIETRFDGLERLVTMVGEKIDAYFSDDAPAKKPRKPRA